MFGMKWLSIFLLPLLISFNNTAKEPVKKIWYNAEQTGKIEIFRAADGYYYGKIVWLKYTNWYDGKPQLDRENTNPQLRTQPLMGLTVIKQMKKVGNNEYAEGTIYDPNSGKILCGKASYTNNILKLTGNFCSCSWLTDSIFWKSAE